MLTSLQVCWTRTWAAQQTSIMEQGVASTTRITLKGIDDPRTSPSNTIPYLGIISKTLLNTSYNYRISSDTLAIGTLPPGTIVSYWIKSRYWQLSGSLRIYNHGCMDQTFSMKLLIHFPWFKFINSILNVCTRNICYSS